MYICVCICAYILVNFLIAAVVLSVCFFIVVAAIGITLLVRMLLLLFTSDATSYLYLCLPCNCLNSYFDCEKFSFRFIPVHSPLVLGFRL